MKALKRNLIGNTYGELTVIKQGEDKICGKNKTYHRRQWICKCSCGKECVVQEDLLLCGRKKSCGHLKRDAMIRAAKTRSKDLEGKQFGNLLVNKRIEDDVSKNGRHYVVYECTCLLCGRKKNVRANNLTNGSTKTCGNCGQRSLKDLTGKTFGDLLVVERAEDTVYENSKSKKINWLCECSCGRLCIADGQMLRDNKKTDCGHSDCSIPEKNIRNLLNELGIEYEPEYKFSDLVSSKERPLRFDFAIFKNNSLKCLIEYQGEQHYWDYQYGYVQREITDKMKKEYCKRNNIPLFEIKYTENIESKLKEILQANSVLS